MRWVYPLLAPQPPEWWQTFIQSLNSAILATIHFFVSLNTAQILVPAFGIWVLVMNFWFREFSRSIYTAYLLVVAVYFIFTILVLSGRFF